MEIPGSPAPFILNRKLMRLIIPFFILAMAGLSLPLKADNDFCSVTNTAFQPGERLTYRVYYTVAGAYFGAGGAVFTNTLEHMIGKDVYHVVAEGKTFSFYDKVYKVRDRYETYIDTTTLQPYKFIRNVNEGGYKTYENVTFVKAASTAVSSEGVYKVPLCVQDPMSAMSFTRNLDFSNLKPGDKVPFNMFLDRQVYSMYVRYMGREIIRTKYAKFRAIKIKPLLINSNVFTGGEKMTVWISDDPNHIALRVESPITVGKIKIDMVDCKNLRYPLSSLVAF